MSQQGAYPIKRRATMPANPHNFGHNAGLHGEDQPYMSDDLEEDERFYVTRPPSSARRYQTSQQQVIQRGNQRLVIHHEPPPRKFHWSFILGLGMLLALGLWVGASQALAWWNNHQLDSTYGMPRTYQVDQVVGHGDSAAHPTHFIFLNLNGHIDIIELPGGDGTHAKIYTGPTLYSDTASQTPVTADFEDVNGDGKVDMIVHIGDQKIIYLNDGTQFKPQQ